MTDPEVVDIPELNPPVVFTVGNANAYISLHDPDLLMVCAGSAAFDDVAMAAIMEQAELHGFPFLSDADVEDWEGTGGQEFTSVELWFTRSLVDALTG